MLKFEAGKTYFAWTQKGELRLMKVAAVSKDGKYIKATYHNNNEKVMEVRGTDVQWVEADSRYKVVVTAEEYKTKEYNVEIINRTTKIKIDWYKVKNVEAELKELEQEKLYYAGCDIYVDGKERISF